MRQNAVTIRVKPRQQGCESRCCGNARRESAIEESTLARQRIDVRRGILAVTVTAEVIGTQAVNNN